MNKTLLLAGIIAFAAGFTYIYYSPPGTLNGLIAFAQEKFGVIVQAWQRLPGPVQSVILLGIPTVFSIFFAYTKSQAMQKLQQQEIDSRATLTQLTGDKNQVIAGLEQQNQNLSTQLVQYENSDGTINSLRNTIAEQDALVQNQKTQIVNLEKAVAQANDKMKGMMIQITREEHLT